MELGIIGLGKMGFNIAQNLHEKGYTIKAYDIDSDTRQLARTTGIIAYDSVEALVADLKDKNLWLMLPAGQITEDTLSILLPLLSKGYTIIEGGNTNYKDSIRRAHRFAQQGIDYLDCGTSGGTAGARHNACLMVGGKREAFNRLEPLFHDLAIAGGYLYAGDSGSGHFLKMVHNGIEYGMMQAMGEGFHLLEASDYNFDLEAVAGVWNNGSVIRSWLMELAQNMFQDSPKLDEYSDVVAASGEGQWTVETALALNVAVPTIALSVMNRSMSQQPEVFGNKVVAGLRHQFGGHGFVEK